MYLDFAIKVFETKATDFFVDLILIPKTVCSKRKDKI